MSATANEARGVWLPKVRPVHLRDVDAVAALYAHYVTHTLVTFDETPPTPGSWVRKLDELAVRGLPFLVAEDAGELVGYAYCSPWRGVKPSYRHTAEDTVYVAPTATGRGVGHALLGAVVDAAATAGVRELVAVVVDTGDPGSLRLHERCGFTEAGRLARVGHKHGQWLDTVLLQRSLPAVTAPGTPAPAA